MASLKNYIDSLASDVKKRCKEKIALVDDIDPYATNKKTWSTAVADYPIITYPDIVNYLQFTKSAYTNDELKNFKSLEAYNQFLSGWVKEISLVDASKKNIIRVTKSGRPVYVEVFLSSHFIDSSEKDSLLSFANSILYFSSN